MKRKHTIHFSEAETYSPPRHTGTLNYRLAGKGGGLATENLEIVLGELQKGAEAEYHYHKDSEQAIFILEGRCTLAFQDGTQEEAGKDDLVILPKGFAHRVVVTSEKFRGVIIYSPKLKEGDIIPFGK